MKLSLSFDDGCKEDLILAEKLSKLDIQATFFIPKNNIEGRKTLNKYDIKEIDNMGHQVESHSLDHIYLTKLDLDKAFNQIVGGKKYLEDILGKEVNGFCFPGGKYNRGLIKLLKKTNIRYARTVHNLHFIKSGFLVNPSMQFFPHTPKSIFINYIKKLPISSTQIFLKTFLIKDIEQRAKETFSIAKRSQKRNFFHLWCHSWELVDYQLLNKYMFFIESLKENSLKSDWTVL